jgi:hypothetical protein
LRRGANSYAIRSVGVQISPAESLSWVVARVAQVPNHAWLVLILLTFAALSVSSLINARERERQARVDRDYTAQRVTAARELNTTIRRQTAQLRTDPRLAEQVAQERLRLVRAHEVVVAIGEPVGGPSGASSSLLARQQ